MKYFSTISFCRQIASILSHAWKDLFLIDNQGKLKSKLIDTIGNSQKWMPSLQGEKQNSTNSIDSIDFNSEKLKINEELSFKHGDGILL